MPSEKNESKLVGKGVFDNGNTLLVYTCLNEYLFTVIDSTGLAIDRGYTEIRDTDVYEPVDYVVLWCEPLDCQGNYKVA